MKNIFNIKSHNKFLPTLANFVVEKYGNDFELANLTILLPSRRSVRELKKCFLDSSESKALILPKILAVGDVDYDDFLTSDLSVSTNLIDYQIELINAIKDWNSKTNLFGKNISIAALSNVADSLKNFLDEVEKENINLDKLKEIDSSEFAFHKQKTLEFLQHFSFEWKNIMLKKGIISTSQKQNLMIKNYDKFLQENGSSNPIIIAGSTGSVASTRDLIKTISNLKNGSVILFGLDQKLDEKIWEEIDEIHPQFALKKLLETLKIKRSDVLGIGNDEKNLIGDLLRLSMFPAQFSDLWQENRIKSHSDGLMQYAPTSIKCKNEFEEAKVIALLMRKVLEKKGKTAALISNDKVLINLVKNNLSKWNIKVDDSKISNLAESKVANYLFLIGKFLSEEFDIVNLLAVLKHPFSNINQELLEKLELKILRDVARFESFDDLIFKTKKYPEIAEFANSIAEIFKDQNHIFAKEKVSFKKAVEAHLSCFQALVKNPENNLVFEDFLFELKNSSSDFEVETQNYNQILNKFLANYQVAPNEIFHPRLHILSTMEARLMNYDLTIISGLVEGQFPSQSFDHLLGSKMRLDLEMSSQNKKIGIAAYDFCNYLQNGEVVISYSENQNNVPNIKSRFLLKLETILKINNLENLFDDGKKYLDFLNESQSRKLAEEKPIYKTAKIKNFSATDISKWLRNPYYVYAKRILKLKPLKQIEQESSFAEFGNFVHKSLEEFVKNYPKNNLLEIGKKNFSDFFPDKTSHLIWMPKFENIAKWFEEKERELRANLAESFVEVEIELMIKDVLLTTKIDRINLYKDGSVEIIDYKTGILPKDKEIQSGLEPQLATEAVILSQGKIKNYSEALVKISGKKINNLQYQNLKGKDQNEVKDLKNPDELINAANQGISGLIALFNEEKNAYICAPNLDIYKKDDYWHLGRINL